MSKIKSKLVSSKIVHGGVLAEAQHLAGIDVLTSHVGIPIIQVYPQGLDIVRLEHSLGTVLGKYPLLAGRLRKDNQGLPYVDGNDAGVAFRVRQCAGPMPPYGPRLHMARQLRSFHTPIYPWNIFRPTCPLMNVDVNRFDDGGVVLSITVAHSVMDGTAFWQFMLDWAETARGGDTPPRSMDRSILITTGQAHLDTPYTRHYVYEMGQWERIRLFARFAWQHLFRLDKGVYRIPADTIEQWKRQAKLEHPDSDGVSTTELVAAHCLKVMAPLWSGHHDRCLGLVIDLRYKRRLRVPRHYFGNALGHGEVMYSPEELASGSMAALALKSRMPADRLTHEDLLGYLGLMERARQKKQLTRLMMRSVARSLDGGLVLNACSHFPIYDIDFGTGKPSWHDAVRVVFRMLMVIATPQGDGGVDIHLTATRQELALFDTLYGRS